MENNNQRNWLIGGVIAIVVIMGLIIWVASSSTGSGNATTTPDGTTSMVSPYGVITLGLGQDGVFPGITIRPVSVAEDSRCNTGVQCIQAGTVRVIVTSTVLGSPTQNTIGIGQTVSVSTFTVALNSVSPYPIAGTKIANSDYRFTFEVHQSIGGSTNTEIQGKG